MSALATLTHLAAVPSPADFASREIIDVTTSASSAWSEFQHRACEDADLFMPLQRAADPEAFVALAVELGAAHGYTFGPAEVRASLLAARRAWLERHIE